MCSSILLGIWKNNHIIRIRFDNCDLTKDVMSLKNEIITRVKDIHPGIVLMYRGVMFEDSHPVSSYGVTSGCTIHVLAKMPATLSPTPPRISEDQLEQLILSFKSIKACNSLMSIRNALQRLSRPEVLDNLVAATPGLSDDHVAVAILKDPELVLEILQPDNIRQIAAKHPALIEATYYIAAHMYDDQMTTTLNDSAATSGYDYSMEALSDDNGMEDDSSDTEPGLPVNFSDTIITPAQLAAGIANATSGIQMPNFTNLNPESVIITNEAFNNAMQQAFQSNQLLTNNNMGNRDRGPGSSGPSATATATPATPSNRWQLQMQQMRDMGLTDDTMNLRVLQATAGDLQAAVELVFDELFQTSRENP